MSAFVFKKFSQLLLPDVSHAWWPIMTHTASTWIGVNLGNNGLVKLVKYKGLLLKKFRNKSTDDVKLLSRCIVKWKFRKRLCYRVINTIKSYESSDESSRLHKYWQVEWVDHSEINYCHANNSYTTTILRPFFRDHQGELVPEENFWTLWCKGRLTEADTPTIWLGATPSGLSSAHLHHPPFFTVHTLGDFSWATKRCVFHGVIHLHRQ